MFYSCQFHTFQSIFITYYVGYSVEASKHRLASTDDNDLEAFSLD